MLNKVVRRNRAKQNRKQRTPSSSNLRHQFQSPRYVVAAASLAGLTLTATNLLAASSTSNNNTFEVEHYLKRSDYNLDFPQFCGAEEEELPKNNSPEQKQVEFEQHQQGEQQQQQQQKNNFINQSLIEKTSATLLSIKKQVDHIANNEDSTFPIYQSLLNDIKSNRRFQRFSRCNKEFEFNNHHQQQQQSCQRLNSFTASNSSKQLSPQEDNEKFHNQENTNNQQSRQQQQKQSQQVTSSTFDCILEKGSIYSLRSSSGSMGHASSKRSRHDPGQHEVVTMSGSRSSHGNKRYMDGGAFRDEYGKGNVGLQSSSKNYRGRGGVSRSPDQGGTAMEMDEEEQAKISGVGSWSPKKLSGGQMIETRNSKEAAVIPRGVNAQPRFLHASAIKLHKLQFGIDKRLTIIDEKSNAVLKYRTPHFRALATVEIPPLPAGVNIQVGWIQVCTDMQFINTYGNEGLTSWEFPEIVSGKYKMVSDADGKQYPWYGSKNEVAHLQGPTQNPTTATIHMNDNFFPQVTWYIPSIGYTRDPSLSFVYRKQRFYTFLALKDVNTDTYQIIRTLTWSMELAIDVNPKNPLGKRAKLLGPFEQESPKVVPEHLTPPLKSYALNPPNANSCQVLVWRPKYGDTELVVPPVQTTMDMSRYLVSTRDATAKLLRITKSNFLLKAQQQQK